MRILTDEEVFNSERYLREFDKKLNPSLFARNFPVLAEHNADLVRGGMRITERQYNILASREKLPGWARVRNGFDWYEHRYVRGKCCDQNRGFHHHVPEECERHQIFVETEFTLSPRDLRAYLAEHREECQHETWDVEFFEAEGRIIRGRCPICGRRKIIHSIGGGAPLTRHVATTGVDTSSRDGLTLGNAWRTVDYGFFGASAFVGGDTLVIHQGSYAENLGSGNPKSGGSLGTMSRMQNFEGDTATLTYGGQEQNWGGNSGGYVEYVGVGGQGGVSRGLVSDYIASPGS